MVVTKANQGYNNVYCRDKLSGFAALRARSSVDRATDSGSVGRGFKSLRARLLYHITCLR